MSLHGPNFYSPFVPCEKLTIVKLLAATGRHWHTCSISIVKYTYISTLM